LDMLRSQQPMDEGMASDPTIGSSSFRAIRQFLESAQAVQVAGEEVVREMRQELIDAESRDRNHSASTSSLLSPAAPRGPGRSSSSEFLVPLTAASGPFVSDGRHRLPPSQGNWTLTSFLRPALLRQDFECEADARAAFEAANSSDGPCVLRNPVGDEVECRSWVGASEIQSSTRSRKVESPERSLVSTPVPPLPPPLMSSRTSVSSDVSPCTSANAPPASARCSSAGVSPTRRVAPSRSPMIAPPAVEKVATPMQVASAAAQPGPELAWNQTWPQACLASALRNLPQTPKGITRKTGSAVLSAQAIAAAVVTPGAWAAPSAKPPSVTATSTVVAGPQRGRRSPANPPTRNSFGSSQIAMKVAQPATSAMTRNNSAFLAQGSSHRTSSR
jgi:hypothetical protein